MMRKHSMWRAIAPAGLAMFVLAGFVPTPVTVTDNFNNNSIGNLWTTTTFGGKGVAEVNQRLQFDANGATGQLSFAGLEVRPWGANWKQDFTLNFDYKLNLANVGGNKQVFLGFGLALAGQWPTTITGMGCGLLRDSSGLHAGFFRYTNGNITDQDGFNVAATTGEIEVEWDRSSDNMTVTRGAQSITYHGLYSQLGAAHGMDPMIITLGCATMHGNITFPGTRVYADDFQFHGVKRAR